MSEPISLPSNLGDIPVLRVALVSCRGCEQTFLVDIEQVMLLECCCFCRATIQVPGAPPPGEGLKGRVQ